MGNSNSNSNNSNSCKRTHSDMMMDDNHEDSAGADGAAAAGSSSSPHPHDHHQHHLDSIRQDLEQVETGLANRRVAAGRAVFDSLTSALGSIRERWNNSHSSTSTSTSTTTTTAAAVAAAAHASSTSTTRNDESSLQERLQAAERAHSARIPLGMLLQNELERREGTTTTTTSNTNMNMVQSQGATGPATTTSQHLKRGDPDNNHKNNQEDENKNKALEEEDAAAAAEEKQRRASTLVASRQFAQAAVDHSVDVELHQGVGGIPLPFQVLAGGDGDGDGAGGGGGGVGDGVPQQQEAETDVRMMEEEQAQQESTQEQGQQDNMEITRTSVAPLLSSNKNNPQQQHETDPSTTPRLSSGSHMLCSSSMSMSMSSTSSLSEQPQPQPPVCRYYSWGQGPHTLHDDEQSKDITQALIPSTTSRIGHSHLTSVATSVSHTACVTDTGNVLVCGDNSQGAVDPSDSMISTTTTTSGSSSKDRSMVVVKPQVLELLQMTRILQVSCGLDHTAAITESRSVLTWGNDQDGQLGHRRLRTTSENPKTTSTTEPTTTPPTTTDLVTSRTRRRPAGMVLGVGRRAAIVTCGHRFTLVLTTRMEVWACGRQEITGYDTTDATASQPVQVLLAQQNPALEALPLVAMAAGSSHAVVITAHGTAYAWGINAHGCCGREVPMEITVPVPITVPATSQQQHMGTNVNDDSSSASPFPNWGLWEHQGDTVTLADDVAAVRVACGEAHTVLVTKSGRLLVCGHNDQQQLGLPEVVPAQSEETSIYPVVPLVHPNDNHKFVTVQAGTNHTLLLDDVGDVWQMGNGHKLETILANKSIIEIAAGGMQNIAIAAGPGLDNNNKQKLALSTTSIANLEPRYGRQLYNGLQEMVDEIIKTGSKDGAIGDAAKELASRIEELFRCPAVVNSLVLNPTEIDELYEKLLGTGSPEERQQVATALEKGMARGLDTIKTARLLYPESMRCLLVYLQCPLLRDSKENTLDLLRGDLLIQSLCETILGLPFEGYKAFLTWSTSLYSKESFVDLLVQPLISQLNKRLENDRTRAVPVIVGVLRWLQNAAERAGHLAAREDFHSKGVANMSMETLYDDLARYKRASKSERSVNFYICANSFLMSPATKRNLLQVENQIKMVLAAQQGGVQFDLARQQFLFNPYFVLAIDRKYMLQQTLQAMASASPGELRKSLKIVFKGEDGIDAGGVTKEFFQLLCAQLFDLNTGMWSMELGDGIHTWFNSDCTWNYDGYYLVGVLVGLAVYNTVILDVHFPSAVYRKLLGLPLGLEDMIDEELQKGLKQLLEYDGDDVEQIFCLTFEITWTDLGTERTKELKPGGCGIAVTSDNKEEYVMLYVKWLLVDSVHTQYKEFERGFMQVMDTSCLDLLRPEELELLAVGSPELDFEALEGNTQYEGGYDKDCPVIRNLWRFVKGASNETQLKFLKFCTGSSKSPIGGLGEMPFKIQRAGPDSIQLPTSHTCFNTLLIPDYGDDYDKLAQRLGRSILECEGFGLQ